MAILVIAEIRVPGSTSGLVIADSLFLLSQRIRPGLAKPIANGPDKARLGYRSGELMLLYSVGIDSLVSKLKDRTLEDKDRK